MCIERSDRFPLAVVALRLPLFSVLADVEAQIIELNRLIIALCDDSQTTLDQSVQQVFEIENKIVLLELKSNEVLDEVAILLDRARFKEREYSIA